MPSTKLLKHSTLYFIASISVMGCQHKPPLPAEPIPPEFPANIYPMAVKGQNFIIDAPWDDKQDLQQQQAAFFSAANEYDSENKSVHKYVKIEELSEGSSQYILKSGLQMSSVEHDFDTFLQFTLKADCKHIETQLHCQYNAIDGLYSVDLPISVSLKAEQTPEQMEKNEIQILSKLFNHPLKITETFKTQLSLSKLKAKLVKQHFLVDSKKPNLYLLRLQYNYELELSQEKIKKGYVITANYYINPINIDAYHADYVKSLALAKSDFKQAVSR